ncbi:hypothetical protein, partial [Burkholderia pseudomallei]|uniref:hypothetical protein n=1 Tax=Burkholderia pseudomallei TaxID=28450 RepID=UPI001C4BA94C
VIRRASPVRCRAGARAYRQITRPLDERTMRRRHTARRRRDIRTVAGNGRAFARSARTGTNALTRTKQSAKTMRASAGSKKLRNFSRASAPQGTEALKCRGASRRRAPR